MLNLPLVTFVSNAGTLSASQVDQNWNNIKTEFTQIEDYSTAEIAIGHWLDGKILYRKVSPFISGGAVNAFGASFSPFAANYVDKLISITFTSLKSGGTITSVPTAVVNVNKATGIITPTSSSGFSNNDTVDAILIYTKQ